MFIKIFQKFMITVKTKEKIEILREGGKKLAKIMKEISQKAEPGIKTIELDKIAEALILKAGGEPSFKNYKTKDDRIPYPASLCVSLNDEVVHGLPSEKIILKNGDIVSLDLGMKYKGLYTDIALTIGIGTIDKKAGKLLKICKIALAKSIKQAKEGRTLGDIGFIIQSYVESHGFQVVRKLVGHGVGYSVHEEPDIPNWGEPGQGEVLKRGMVLAIEPMIVEGGPDVFLTSDGWTWKTKDGSRAAHFEHTIAVGKNKGEILTL
ncbi:MAG: Methionine aminopeptidase [Parcubacteria group bacterium GW2011_GWA2_42_35]|nr:MAG: Methionine aminopeptidase [Parcubacteria group bacterium GW2011_GWC2_42_13]KKS58016.1 MAG: Methionine aminopeptidase [Parcubacteria group bacterium GW2011_GWA2_42_35]